MIYVVIGMFLVTTFLFSLALFQRLFRKKNRMHHRVNRYLKHELERKQPKKPTFTFDLKLTKQQIRKKVLTKDKNSKLEVMLNRAGVPLKPEEYIMFQWISTALVGGILYLFSDNLLLLVVGAIVGNIVPRLVLKKKQKDRLKQFNDDLPEMISTIIGALRAGFSFQQALKSVMEEAASPMKEEVTIVFKEMQYGAGVEEALNQLKERMPSEDLDLMIQAIIIQRQVGGNLATVLEKIVETIRDRMKIQGQISTLTAQGRLSGAIVGLLPVILGMALFLIEPDYIGSLFGNPIGIGMVVIAGISSMIGFIMIRKLTTIEV